MVNAVHYKDKKKLFRYFLVIPAPAIKIMLRFLLRFRGCCQSYIYIRYTPDYRMMHMIVWLIHKVWWWLYIVHAQEQLRKSKILYLTVKEKKNCHFFFFSTSWRSQRCVCGGGFQFFGRVNSQFIFPFLYFKDIYKYRQIYRGQAPPSHNFFFYKVLNILNVI